MIRKTLILFALIIVVNSCKENKEPEQKVKVENKGIKNTLVVKINGVFTKDDKFQMLYTESKEETYTLKKVIKRKIIGSPEEQELIFTLPKEIYPSKLRLDFGKNKEQGTIMINTVSISLDGESIEISNTEFLSYFKPNTWISKVGVNNESEYNLVVKDVKVSDSRTVSYAPYFSATPKLIFVLEGL